VQEGLDLQPAPRTRAVGAKCEAKTTSRGDCDDAGQTGNPHRGAKLSRTDRCAVAELPTSLAPQAQTVPSF